MITPIKQSIARLEKNSTPMLGEADRLHKRIDTLDMKFDKIIDLLNVQSKALNSIILNKVSNKNYIQENEQEIKSIHTTNKNTEASERNSTTSNVSLNKDQIKNDWFN